MRATLPKLVVMLLPTLLAALLLLPTAAAAQKAPKELKEIRTLEGRYLLGDVAKVHLALPFGGLRVEAVEGRIIEIEVRLECSKVDLEICTEQANRIQLAPRQKKNEILVKLAHTPGGRSRGIEASAIARVPRDAALEIDIGSGDVFLTGHRADAAVAVVAGDVDIVAVKDALGLVDVDVAIGKAEMWLSEGSIQGTGFPKSLKWNGPGQAVLKVNVGTGDVRIRFGDAAETAAATPTDSE